MPVARSQRLIKARGDFMLLILKDLKKVLSFFPVIARLDRAIQIKELDYPVKSRIMTNIGTKFTINYGINYLLLNLLLHLYESQPWPKGY
jgi:hypothetical protein